MRNIKLIGAEVFTPNGRMSLIDAWARDLKLTNTEYKVSLNRGETYLTYIFLKVEGETVLFELDPEATVNTSKGHTKVKHLLKDDEVVILKEGDILNGPPKEVLCRISEIHSYREFYYFEIKGEDIKTINIYNKGAYLQIH